MNLGERLSLRIHVLETGKKMASEVCRQFEEFTE